MHEVIVVCAETAELAFGFNSRLFSLSVEEGLPKQASTMGEVDEFKRERDRYFEGVRAEAAAIALEHHATLTTEVRVGHAADAIVRFVAEVGADLVGARLTSGISGFSVSLSGQPPGGSARLRMRRC